MVQITERSPIFHLSVWLYAFGSQLVSRLVVVAAVSVVAPPSLIDCTICTNSDWYSPETDAVDSLAHMRAHRRESGGANIVGGDTTCAAGWRECIRICARMCHMELLCNSLAFNSLQRRLSNRQFSYNAQLMHIGCEIEIPLAELVAGERFWCLWALCLVWIFT